MMPESTPIQSPAHATAERAANLLQESLRIGETYLVPLPPYQNNIIIPVKGSGDYHVLPFPVLRTVEVFYRTTIRTITATVDRRGRPVIRVEVEAMERFDFAIRRTGEKSLTYGSYRPDGEQLGLLTFRPNVPLPEDLQGLAIAPETVRINRQILKFFPQDVRIEYYIPESAYEEYYRDRER